MMMNTKDMNKLNTDALAMVSAGTGPLTSCDPPCKTGPLNYETGPLGTCDPPYKAGPSGFPPC